MSQALEHADCIRQNHIVKQINSYEEIDENMIALTVLEKYMSPTRSVRALARHSLTVQKDARTEKYAVSG